MTVEEWSVLLGGVAANGTVGFAAAIVYLFASGRIVSMAVVEKLLDDQREALLVAIREWERSIRDHKKAREDVLD